jgi:hypothetical protein
MGRLAHLKRTLPLLLDAGLRVVLVDYSCPDRCGDWAKQAEVDALSAGSLAIARVLDQRVFHKAQAHNLGAAAAIALGAEYLCFIDADTLVTHGFADWCREHATEGRFGIVKPTPSSGDLTGILLVSAKDVEKLGGFDESFVGYGMEDVELRVRYRIVGGLEYDLMPSALVSSIPHGNELRMRHYVLKDRRTAVSANFRRLSALVERWTGEKLGQLHRPDLTPLLGIYPVTPPASAGRARSARGRRQRRPQQRVRRQPSSQG